MLLFISVYLLKQPLGKQISKNKLMMRFSTYAIAKKERMRPKKQLGPHLFTSMQVYH